MKLTGGLSVGNCLWGIVRRGAVHRSQKTCLPILCHPEGSRGIYFYRTKQISPFSTPPFPPNYTTPFPICLPVFVHPENPCGPNINPVPYPQTAPKIPAFSHPATPPFPCHCTVGTPVPGCPPIRYPSVGNGLDRSAYTVLRIDGMAKAIPYTVGAGVPDGPLVRPFWASLRAVEDASPYNLRPI